MIRPDRFTLLLGWCAAACSGTVEDGNVANHGDSAMVGAGGATGSAAGSTTTLVGATGTVGAGQGGTTTSQGGAGGADEPTDALEERPAVSIDAGDAAAREDARSDMTDGAIGDGASVDAGPVGPIVPPDCPGDPTDGWTEYASSFIVQHPYHLMVSDRYTFENGIHTFWVLPSDKPFEVGNTTAPRTEARYPNFTTGQRMWSGDILVDSPSNSVTIFQIHHTTTGAGPVYLQVNGGTLRELDGQLVLSNMLGKWFNLKVAFDAPTASATYYVNNCQKLVLHNSRPGDHVYYFKHGTYTCTSSICRDHYKNIHTYQR